MEKRLIILIISLLTVFQIANADDSEAKTSPLDSIFYMVEMQGSMSFDGGKTPLWLNANKYGLSSLDKNNGYLRAATIRPLSVDNEKNGESAMALTLLVLLTTQARLLYSRLMQKGDGSKVCLPLAARNIQWSLRTKSLVAVRRL